jgi:Ca2+-binding EF-hand superfamily protein
MKELGFTFEAAVVAKYFAQYDTDNSGSLDKAECRKLVSDLEPDFF